VPRIIVQATFVNDDGSPMWGYVHEERVMPRASDGDDLKAHFLDAGQQILDELDSAKESISRQIAATASHLGDS
jgi:hypothetical protein